MIENFPTTVPIVTINMRGTSVPIAPGDEKHTTLLTGLGQYKLTTPQIHCNWLSADHVSVEMRTKAHIRQNLYNRTLEVTTVIIGNNPTTDQAGNIPIVETISAITRV